MRGFYYNSILCTVDFGQVRNISQIIIKNMRFIDFLVSLLTLAMVIIILFVFHINGVT
jgi:hypothetical protein